MDGLLGNEYSPELLKMLGIDAEKMRQQQQQQGLLNAGLALLAGSGPSSQPTSLGQLAAQAGMQGIQAYQGAGENAISNRLKQYQIASQLAQANAPKYMTLKSGDSEVLVQVPKMGTPSIVPIQGISSGGSIKFDDTTRAYMSYKYPGKAFGDLTQDQQVDVISFANAPNDEKIASLKVESSKSKFETGVDVPIPRGRSDFLARPKVVPSAAAPSVAPSPTSLDMTSKQAPAVVKTIDKAEPTSSNIKIPMSLVSKDMTQKDVPLIESSGISPKQKQELLLQKPQATGAVEAVVNTNRLMRDAIKEILANPGLKDAFGLGGEAMSKFPGSNAARVRALLEKLGGNLFVDAITAMRNASKTGAAVGNATEKEGDKLQASRAALSQAQKAEDVIRELTALDKMLEQQEKITINAFNRTYGYGNFQLVPMKPAPNMRQPLESIFGTQR